MSDAMDDVAIESMKRYLDKNFVQLDWLAEDLGVSKETVLNVTVENLMNGSVVICFSCKIVGTPEEINNHNSRVHPNRKPVVASSEEGRASGFFDIPESSFPFTVVGTDPDNDHHLVWSMTVTAPGAITVPARPEDVRYVDVTVSYPDKVESVE